MTSNGTIHLAQTIPIRTTRRQISSHTMGGSPATSRPGSLLALDRVLPSTARIFHAPDRRLSTLSPMTNPSTARLAGNQLPSEISP